MKYTRKRRSGGGFFGSTPKKVEKPKHDISSYIFSSNKISTQPNVDPSYKEIGIIHYTDSGAVNALRDLATGISNAFGRKGFDNIIYDNLRNEALAEFSKKVNEKQKVSNLRIDFDHNVTDTIFIHIYGTLLQKS